MDQVKKYEHSHCLLSCIVEWGGVSLLGGWGISMHNVWGEHCDGRGRHPKGQSQKKRWLCTTPPRHFPLLGHRACLNREGEVAWTIPCGQWLQDAGTHNQIFNVAWSRILTACSRNPSFDLFDIFLHVATSGLIWVQFIKGFPSNRPTNFNELGLLEIHSTLIKGLSMPSTRHGLEVNQALSEI